MVTLCLTVVVILNFLIENHNLYQRVENITRVILCNTMLCGGYRFCKGRYTNMFEIKL